MSVEIHASFSFSWSLLFLWICQTILCREICRCPILNLDILNFETMGVDDRAITPLNRLFVIVVPCPKI